MDFIDEIFVAIRRDRVRITDHPDEEAQADDLSLDEVFDSVFLGEVIEEYPDDRPFPSCLIYGNMTAGEPIHSVWAYNSETGWAAIITVYRPDPGRWLNCRTRRPR